MIFTNPLLIPAELMFDSISCLIPLIHHEESHHQLLVYEGLMALTNLSSTEPTLRDKIVAAGAWSHCAELIAK